VRAPAEEVPFTGLVSDVVGVAGLVGALRRLVALVGGEKDTAVLRQGIESGMQEIRVRLRNLERCIKFNRDNAAAVGAGSDASVDALVARGAGVGAGALSLQRSRFDAAAAATAPPGNRFGRGSASAAGVGAAGAPDKRAWEKLALDCANVTRGFQAEERSFFGRVSQCPRPPGGGSHVATAAQAAAGNGSARSGVGAGAAPLRASSATERTPGEPARGGARASGAAGSGADWGCGDATRGYIGAGAGDAAGADADGDDAGADADGDGDGGGDRLRVQVLAADEYEVMEAIVDERDQEITHIAREVNELADMFRDLGTLVNEQGTGIDAIASNIESARGRVIDGVKHLESADKFQRNATCAVM
jgi:hypothetical protein